MVDLAPPWSGRENAMVARERDGGGSAENLWLHVGVVELIDFLVFVIPSCSSALRPATLVRTVATTKFLQVLAARRPVVNRGAGLQTADRPASLAGR